MNKLTLKWLTLGGLSLLILICITLSIFFRQTLYAPLKIGHNTVIFEVSANDGARKIINRLYAKHYISTQAPLVFYAKFYHVSQNLKAGIYEIYPGDTILDFFDRVIRGKVLKLNLRIPEGSRLSEVKMIFSSAPYLVFDALGFEKIKGQHPNAEGLLLAETYQYNALSSSNAVIELANQSLGTLLESLWKNRAPNLPYKTPYEMLIAASIIEKETGIAAERPIISGVIVNRLIKNMPLQMDPTVIYGLGSLYQGKLHHDDMRFPSPYNTYVNRGLPPTPIAMVGKAALIAAAHPVSTSYLYFVAKGDGTHEFSSTYTQQRQAIKKYQQRTVH